MGPFLFKWRLVSVLKMPNYFNIYIPQKTIGGIKQNILPAGGGIFWTCSTGCVAVTAAAAGTTAADAPCWSPDAPLSSTDASAAVSGRPKAASASFNSAGCSDC